MKGSEKRSEDILNIAKLVIFSLHNNKPILLLTKQHSTEKEITVITSTILDNHILFHSIDRRITYFFNLSDIQKAFMP